MGRKKLKIPMSPNSRAKLAAYKTAHRESGMDSESDGSDTEDSIYPPLRK
jgi:hypothetical protein